MPRLFARGAALVVLVACTMYLFVIVAFDGRSDSYYLRFTTPKAPSLVLGSSRAAQGIVPSVLNASDLEFARPLYNFGFNENYTPYGRYYFNLVKKKLALSKQRGLFILSVDPWSISCNQKEPLNDDTRWREARGIAGRMHSVHRNPNIEYVWLFFDRPLYKALLEPYAAEIQEDGWLDVSVPMDSAQVRNRTMQKLKRYRGNLSRWRFARLRYAYLDSTVDYLATRGDVYLVRLPISPEMFEIERQFLPAFDSLMVTVADRGHASYFNLAGRSSEFQTTDGNHLWQGSAIAATQDIAEYIRRSSLKGTPASH